MEASRTRKKRAYNSTLRRKQAEATRELILDGVESLFGDPNVRDFTVADVARAAEVSPATVFRQFDGRQALFDAWLDRAAERFKVPTVPEYDLDNLAEIVPRLHAYFAANVPLFEAVRGAPELFKLVESQRRRRNKKMVAAVARRYPQWSASQHAAAASALQVVMSPDTWRWLAASKSTAPRTSEVVVDMVRALIDRMDTHGPLGGHEEEA